MSGHEQVRDSKGRKCGFAAAVGKEMENRTSVKLSPDSRRKPVVGVLEPLYFRLNKTPVFRESLNDVVLLLACFPAVKLQENLLSLYFLCSNF